MVISAQRGFRNSTGFWFWGIPNIQHYISVRCGKDSACQYSIHKRCGFDSRVRKNPWSRKWQPSPVFLPQKFHGQRSLSSVQSLSRVQLFATPWTAACQASLSNTNSQACSHSCPLSRWCHPPTPMNSMKRQRSLAGYYPWSHKVNHHWARGTHSFRCTI